MIETLSQIQTHVHGMREDLIKEGSVMPDECVITCLEAKKKVIWYLDLMAAAIAGAHRHMSNVQHDDISNEGEEDELTQRIVERLRKELGTLQPEIKDFFYCLANHFKVLDSDMLRPPLHVRTRKKLSDKRQVVEETLAQLELLDREMDDIRSILQETVRRQSNERNDKIG